MPPLFAQTVFFTVFAPFVAAALATGIAARHMAVATWLLALVPALAFAGLLALVPAVANGEVFNASLPWIPALGVDLSFYVDGLSLTFALLISGIGALIVLYAGGYLHGHRHLGRFFSFLLLFMGAMLGLVLADNLVTLFIFWELTSIASFLLIGFGHESARARRAALQALVVTGGGGLALLGAIAAIIVASDGMMSLSELLQGGDILRESPLYAMILCLVLGGAFAKSAQFPLHFWLPNAMEAPTPVSAYLHSATMVKAGVYLLMRLQPVLGDTGLWQTILPVFGAATLLAGALLALRQSDLKLMLAYTTVASLGLLVMLTGIGGEMAIAGAVLYLIAHALFKGALFMVAGVIDHGTGTRDIRVLGGLRKAMPVTFLAAGLAALSMAGLPPFIGFVAKETLYAGALAGDAPALWGALLAGVAVIGNALMLAVAGAIALIPFFARDAQLPRPAHEGGVLLLAGPVVLALAGLVLALALPLTARYLALPMGRAVSGAAIAPDLHLLPVALNMPVILSVLTIGIGLLALRLLVRLRAGLARALDRIGWGPDRGFDQAINGLVRGSARVSHFIQNGRLSFYMMMTFALLACAVLGSAAGYGIMPAWPERIDMRFAETGIVLIALGGLIAVLLARSRLVAIVSLGIQGFAVAVLFMLYGAPDLSFTQFLVETLSVVIVTFVLTHLKLTQRDARRPARRLRDGLIALAVGIGIGGLLLRITQGPFNAEISEFFAQYARVIAHGRNIVNVIIVDFRGVDTLGEIAVVLIAGLCIFGLLRRPPGIQITAPDADAAAPVSPASVSPAAPARPI